MKPTPIIRLISSLSLMVCFVPVCANLKYNPEQTDQFNKTNQCVGCDLSNASLYGNHSQANLDKANLSGAGADNMNLSEALITNANLTKTNFANSNLSAANFTGSVLIDADLSDTDLYQAVISTEQLAQASSVCRAILPDGSKGKC